MSIDDFIRPLIWTALTIGCYAVGLCVKKVARGNALANPVLIAIVMIACLLRMSRTPYETYFHATWALNFLLGPATVALGVPLAHSAGVVRQNARGIVLGLIAGCLTSMLSGVLIVRSLGGSKLVAMSMLPKAVTTPIAIAVAVQIGGQPALTASLAIVGGIVAAMVLEGVLRLIHVRDEAAIGLSAGTAGSGIAAAHAARLGTTAAAFAAIGIGLNGLLTAVLAPLLASFFR